jgi:hypothetical protein
VYFKILNKSCTKDILKYCIPKIESLFFYEKKMENDKWKKEKWKEKGGK